MDLSIAIFSYNRGDFVKNCIASIEQCVSKEVSITLYDDDSTDKRTLEYLSSQAYPVINCGNSGSNRHGGLYENMQLALEATKSKYLLFLQDDTQLVRRLDEIDLKSIDAFFDEDQTAAFMNPVFLKGHRRKSIDKQLRPETKYRGYFQEISESLKPRPVSMYYCDVVLANVARLKSVAWTFKESETSNAFQAKAHFSKMLQLADPFVMHVPEVPVFRGRTSTFGARLAEKVVGSDIKQFQIMSDLQVTEMRSRSLSLSPYAEDFLCTVNPKVRTPYTYNAINARLYTRILHKLEYGFRRLLNR